jgi:Caspase domain
MHRVAITIACTICALLIGILSPSSAYAGRRVALVIGNSGYKHADMLPNTVNDARAIAAMLRTAGFDSVDERENLSAIEFKRALRDFMTAAKDADIAIVYFSGHGVEINGTNYVVPVDAKLQSDFDTEDEAISLDRIIMAVQPAQRLRLIILDACRDNPFLQTGPRQFVVRRVTKGLLPIDPMGADTLIAYAAKAGSVSYDGEGSSSPFTSAVVKYLAEPGLDIRIAFGRVRDQVLAATARRQEPFLYGSLGGATISLVPAPTQAPAAADPAAALNDYLFAERIGTRQAWESFLARHPSGFYADLARAQLAKLAAGTGTLRGPPEAAPPEKAPSERVSKERDCKRDAERLARVRANPILEEVERFWRELTCDDLRPQVARLLESVGAKVIPVIGPTALPRPATPAPSDRSPQIPEAKELVCKRESELLARLRANPTPEEIKRFSRELACEDLRPQTLRLLESVGG